MTERYSFIFQAWKIICKKKILLCIIILYLILYICHCLIELETKTVKNGVFLSSSSSSSSKSWEFFIRTEVLFVRLSFLDVLHEALLLALGLCGLNYFVSKSYVICKVWTLDNIYWQIVILFRLILPMVTMLKLLSFRWTFIPKLGRSVSIWKILVFFQKSNWVHHN